MICRYYRCGKEIPNNGNLYYCDNDCNGAQARNVEIYTENGYFEKHRNTVIRNSSSRKAMQEADLMINK